MTSFFWSTLLLVATGATARKEFIHDVILLEYLATGCYRCYKCYSSQGVHLWRHSFGVPCYWLLQVLQLARSSSLTSFFWSTLLLVATGATGATARKEFIHDVILLEYLATGCYRCYSSQGVHLWRHSFGVPCYWLLQVLQLARSSSMTSFFWSTLLLVATGATASKEFIYDVILFGVPCYWLLQVLQLARSSSMTSVILEYFATGSYRCYSVSENPRFLRATSRNKSGCVIKLWNLLAIACYRSQSC